MKQEFANIPQTLQAFPPKWAHFCLHIERFVQDRYSINLSGRKILVGLSGGIDSTALLLALSALVRKSNGSVIGVHLDHGIRDCSAQDALWAHNICSALSIECISKRIDIGQMAQNEQIGLEEAGRKARYALFSEVLNTHQADYIALGHHLDDLCEDVLMRLMRGTAWPGLSGMDGYDPDRNLIRPFLLTPKGKLREFLVALGVPWREDETNSSPEWTRNRVRSDILPAFLKENPNFRDTVARMWRVGRADKNFWNNRFEPRESLPNEELKNLHQAERLRLYKACLDALGAGQVLADTLFKLDAAWLNNRHGTMFQFPGNKSASVEHCGIVFSTSH